MRYGLLILAGAFLACASSQTKTISQSTWQESMRDISKSFSKLIKYAYSGNEYLKPENSDAIEAELKQMTSLAEKIHQHGSNPAFDKDPVLKYVTRDFSRDMSIALIELKGGHPEFSRSVIKATSNYCISCHTRNDQGVKNAASFMQTDLSGLGGIEKADYLAAVRQFPEALNTYDNILTDTKFVTEHPRDWAIGMKKSLAIAVRVNRNPSLALELVSRVFDAKTVPLRMREAAITWRVAVKEWRDNEKAQEKLSPKEQIKQVRLLIAKAQGAISQTWNAEAGLIYYLRASSLLHDILRQQKGLSDFSEALYLAGLAAEGLSEINLWTFDEIYYESCIRYKPHSDSSRKCYSRLEALRLFSPKLYSTDDANKLKELRDLAI